MALKRGLGRGLDAILQKPEEDRRPTREMPVDWLTPNRFQPRLRFEEDSLRGLADSIAAQGVIQPLVVSRAEGGKFEIVAGERRWRAAQLAGLETVPVVVREAIDDRQLLELALVENLQRTDLNAIEEAEAFRSLREGFDLSQADIGERVGRSRTAVTNSLRLLRLPPKVQGLLREGRLSAGQARPLLSLGTEREQIELAERAVAEGLSARRLESLARGSSAKPRRKSRSAGTDVHAMAAAERLTRALQTKVEIVRRGQRGTIRIPFQSEGELMRIYDLLSAIGGSDVQE
jgi:ParB family chromosome partitioning protein